jgi:hypothetical protein
VSDELTSEEMAAVKNNLEAGVYAEHSVISNLVLGHDYLRDKLARAEKALDLALTAIKYQLANSSVLLEEIDSILNPKQKD